MKRRKEHLVEKRCGRTEFLRATKLARSIDQAMRSVGVDESWRALELANVVLVALRQRAFAEKGGGVTSGGFSSGNSATGNPTTGIAQMTTSAIADAVQHVLVVTGQPNAAVAYGAVGAERARRHRSLATLGRAPVGTDTIATAAAPRPPTRPPTRPEAQRRSGSDRFGQE